MLSTSKISIGHATCCHFPSVYQIHFSDMKSSRLGLEGKEWGRREKDQLEQIMLKTAIMEPNAFYANEDKA